MRPYYRHRTGLVSGKYLACENTTDSDLAVGVPSETIGAAGSTGIVQILPGSAAFLTGTGSKTFGQNTSGVADSAEILDQMGFALGR